MSIKTWTEEEILSTDLNTNVHKAYYQGELASTGAYNAVSVGSTATVIKAANASRGAILIRNNGSQNIWIGPSGVTTSTGYKLAPLKMIYLRDKSAIYGIVASGTCDVRYLEVQ